MVILTINDLNNYSLLRIAKRIGLISERLFDYSKMDNSKEIPHRPIKCQSVQLPSVKVSEEEGSAIQTPKTIIPGASTARTRQPSYFKEDGTFIDTDTNESFGTNEMDALMLFIKTSFLNKCPVAKQQAVREMVIHLKKTEEERTFNILFRISTLLKSIDFLKNAKLQEAEFLMLAKSIQYNYNKTDQIIFNYGDYGENFYILMEGTVGVRVPVVIDTADLSPKGIKIKKIEQVERLELHSGVAFGEYALITDAKRSATIIAKCDCHIATIAKKDYLAMMRHKEGKKLIQTVNFFINLPYFKDRSMRQLQQMFFIFASAEIPKNHIVFDVDQKANQIYIVKSGEFELEIDIEKYFEGDIVKKGEIASKNKIIKRSTPTLKRASQATKEKFKMLKFAMICQGQMIGVEDALLGRPHTSRLTSKYIGGSVYSCSIHEFKKNIMNIPYTMKIICEEIEQRRRRICDKLGQHARIKALETNNFMDGYRKQCNEEQCYEPLPIFAQENTLSNINEFLSEGEDRSGNRGKYRSYERQKEAPTLEKIVESVKDLNTVVDSVSYTKRNQYRTFDERSYDRALPSKDIKGARSFFQSIPKFKKPFTTKKAPEGNKLENIHERQINSPNLSPINTSHILPKCLSATQLQLEDPNFLAPLAPSKEFTSRNNIIGSRQFKSIQPHTTLSQDSSLMSPTRSYMLGNKSEKSINLSIMANRGKVNLFSDSERRNGNSKRREEERMWSREELSSRINSDNERMGIIKKKERKLGRRINDKSRIFSNDEIKWGDKTFIKFAEIFRKSRNSEEGNLHTSQSYQHPKQSLSYLHRSYDENPSFNLLQIQEKLPKKVFKISSRKGSKGRGKRITSHTHLHKNNQKPPLFQYGKHYITDHSLKS